MKNNCEIIQDLIPLYCDGCASDASRKEVEEHIDECRECRSFAASYRRASKISAHTSPASTREFDIDIDLPYRNLAEKIRIRRRINTACSIGAVIAGAMALTFGFDKVMKK
jgi:predicted anti-sigma-YlaC factor YlaD